MGSTLPRRVSGPAPPDESGWYAADVRSQYHVGHGIVATVTETDDGYAYATREPLLTATERELRDAVTEQFDEAELSRPRTRAGAVERVEAGLPDHLATQIDGLARRCPRSRRRLQYHLLAALRSLGPLSALALDDRVRIADTSEARLTVHTRDFAPARTELSADERYLDRFLGERLTRREVTFAGVSIPVSVVRAHVLGADRFETTYVIEEPPLSPGDRELIETVCERIVEAPPQGIRERGVEAIPERARQLLGRRLGPGANPIEDLRGWLSGGGSGGAHTRRERIDALGYYVTRELIGDGPLTIPLRDPAIRAIEANQVGDRVTVVTHRGATPGGTRMPTTLSIDEREFVDVARSLAADGGVELNVDRPSATVSLTRETPDGPRELSCSVALPDGDGAGHVSVRTERVSPPTPIDLIESGQLSTALVAGIWTAAAEGGTVLFLGPVDAEPDAALGAHAPFIPAEKRPVEIGPGGSRVAIPHETAISVPPGRDGDADWTDPLQREALHPDVAVLPGLDADHVDGLGTILASGWPVFGAVRTASLDLFANHVEQAGRADAVRAQVDLVVELPGAEAAGPATGWVPERTPSDEPASDGDRTPLLTWQRFAPQEAADPPTPADEYLDRLAAAQTGDRSAVEAAVARRYRYVSYLEAEGQTDREQLLGFLSDLRTDEAATIERISSRGSG